MRFIKTKYSIIAAFIFLSENGQCTLIKASKLAKMLVFISAPFYLMLLGILNKDNTT